MDSGNSITEDLREIYLSTLDACRPGTILRDALEHGRVSIPPATGFIVALGKCAVSLAVEAAELTGCDRGLVIHPEGYETDVELPDAMERLTGSHPVPSERSERAARRALDLVRHQRRPILFLVSGGASACVEAGLDPWFSFDEVVRVNERLLVSGLAIEQINTVRRHLSSIKGGRLGAIAPPGSVTLVYSDVPPGRPELVGSGPTANDPTTLAEAASILDGLGDELSFRVAAVLRGGAVPETLKTSPTRVEVIADSEVMIEAAVNECRARGFGARRGPSLDGDANDLARTLAREVAALDPREVLVCAGEPTVVVRGRGEGGRCSELGARFALEMDRAGMHGVAALFGSSDGRDGASPAAAVLVRPGGGTRLDPERASEALARSASYELVADFGEPIIMMPTGNNLRDIALICRGD